MSEGYIYEIRCNITDEVYIGCTESSLEERINHHQKILNTCNSRIIIKRGNYTYKIIEEIDDRNILFEREKYHIENSNGTVINEWRFEANNDSDDEKTNQYLKTKGKQRYEKTKDEMKLEFRCVCGATIRGERHLVPHYKTKKHEKFMAMTTKEKKAYLEKLEKTRPYYQDRYQKLEKERKLEKEDCPLCAKSITKSKIERHQKGRNCLATCDKCNVKMSYQLYQNHIKVCKLV